MSDDEQKDTPENEHEFGFPWKVTIVYDTVDDDRLPWASWGKVSNKPLRKDCFLCHKLLADGEVIVCAECNPNPFVVVGSGLGGNDGQ